MGRAKDIRVEPIAASDAVRIVRKLHYSGKVVQNSQVHLGVFLDGRCGGALQLGPSMDKRKMIGLVAGTEWNEFLELNRLALADWLPRNSESRVIAVTMRILRRHYPWLKWVVSYADATQCGDGTIYRASGFVLTMIKRNSQIYGFPDGTVAHKMVFETARPTPQQRKLRGRLGMQTAPVTKLLRAAGAEQLEGFQLRYIYFLQPKERANLTVPELPYDAIREAGATMYKGIRGGSKDSVAASNQEAEGGATPTSPLDDA